MKMLGVIFCISYKIVPLTAATLPIIMLWQQTTATLLPRGRLSTPTTLMRRPLSTTEQTAADEIYATEKNKAISLHIN
jgi:hypothetical protein